MARILLLQRLFPGIFASDLTGLCLQGNIGPIRAGSSPESVTSGHYQSGDQGGLTMTDSKPPVHISVVLDRSGSMAAIADDIVGGCNEYLGRQQQEPGE